MEDINSEILPQRGLLEKSSPNESTINNNVNNNIKNEINNNKNKDTFKYQKVDKNKIKIKKRVDNTMTRAKSPPQYVVD